MTLKLTVTAIVVAAAIFGAAPIETKGACLFILGALWLIEAMTQDLEWLIDGR